MLLPLASQIGFIAHFTWQKAYIISEHCVNKEVPKLKCDGKCHLRRYVQASQQQDQPTEQAPSLLLESLKELANLLFIAEKIPINFSTTPNIVFQESSRNAWLNLISPYRGRTHLQKLIKPPTV